LKRRPHVTAVSIAHRRFFSNGAAAALPTLHPPIGSPFQYSNQGAGPISLDALIGRGIAATALPLAGRITRVFEALSRRGDPSIKLLLRCWIAALFFRSGVMKISNFDMMQMLFHARSTQWLLPPELAARLTILLSSLPV
jgi:hypothetical protein